MAKQVIKLPPREKWPRSVPREPQRVVRFEPQIEPGGQLRPSGAVIYLVPASCDDVDRNEDGWLVSSSLCGIVEELLVRPGDIVDAESPLLTAVTGVLRFDPKLGCHVVDPVDNKMLKEIKTQTTAVNEAAALVVSVRELAEKIDSGDELTGNEPLVIEKWSHFTGWFIDIYAKSIVQMATRLVQKTLANQKDAPHYLSADDLAHETLVIIEEDWRKGLILSSFLKWRDVDSNRRLRYHLAKRVELKVPEAFRRIRKQHGDTREQACERIVNMQEDPSINPESLDDYLPEDFQAIFFQWYNHARADLGDLMKRDFDYWLGPILNGMTVKDWINAYPQEFRVPFTKREALDHRRLDIRIRHVRAMKKLVRVGINFYRFHPEHLLRPLTKEEIYECILAIFVACCVPIEVETYNLVFEQCWGITGSSESS